MAEVLLIVSRFSEDGDDDTELGDDLPLAAAARLLALVAAPLSISKTSTEESFAPSPGCADAMSADPVDDVRSDDARDVHSIVVGMN